VPCPYVNQCARQILAPQDTCIVVRYMMQSALWLAGSCVNFVVSLDVDYLCIFNR